MFFGSYFPLASIHFSHLDLILFHFNLFHFLWHVFFNFMPSHFWFHILFSLLFIPLTKMESCAFSVYRPIFSFRRWNFIWSNNLSFISPYKNNRREENWIVTFFVPKLASKMLPFLNLIYCIDFRKWHQSTNKGMYFVTSFYLISDFLWFHLLFAYYR